MPAAAQHNSLPVRLQFAVTLGGIGLLAFAAIKYFDIDVQEILDANKGRSR